LKGKRLVNKGWYGQKLLYSSYCFSIFKWEEVWAESNKEEKKFKKLWENSTARKEIRYYRKWKQLIKDKIILTTPIKWIRIALIIP